MLGSTANGNPRRMTYARERGGFRTEEWTHQRNAASQFAPLRHSPKTPRSGPAKERQQHRFGLIGRVVSGEDAARADLVRHHRQGRIALGP